MVPVREAINSGAWLHFSFDDGTNQLRLRVLSFEKIDLIQVDNHEQIEHDESGAQWWLMKIEAVNLNKSQIIPGLMHQYILLVDQQGFQFNVTVDSHLWCFSGFSDESGLHRFYNDELIPKTKRVGAIAFLLPDDNEAEYSLAMKYGTVREA